MTSLARSIHRLVVGSHLLLFAVVIAWRTGGQFTITNVVWALVLCVPLMLPAWGLWQAKRYTHAWATLCVIPYFIIGVTEAVADPLQRFWAGMCLALSLTFFTALIAYLRVSALGAAI